MRKLLVVISSIFLAAARASAEDVTLPAVASLVGGNPFFSDVRVFNTSYAESLDVTATYRCFIETAQGSCPTSAPVLNISLAPREARAFNDMVAAADGFNAHDTAGGVEFEYSGSGDQLVVTSRLFSTSPQNSVGMFIPGLDNSEAHPTTVLTSIRHSADFRTNVGVYNREDSGVSVTFTIFDEGRNQVGSPVTRNVAGHAGLQVSGIFEAAGAGSVNTSNAVIVVAASGEVFSYAAVLDNRTADPIFVVGAEDQPPQPITPVATVGGPTSTPTPPGPTVTPTPPSGVVRTVEVGPNNDMIFVDQISGNSTTTITVGTTVHWVWVDSDPHSTTSDTGIWDSGEHGEDFVFDRPFNTAGTFPYHCTVHGTQMSGTVVVNP